MWLHSMELDFWNFSHPGAGKFKWYQNFFDIKPVLTVDSTSDHLNIDISGVTLIFILINYSTLREDPFIYLLYPITD